MLETIEEPDLDSDKLGTPEAPSVRGANMHKIKGQVAVITGAAGGIGQALALDMARRGAAGIALVDFPIDMTRETRIIRQKLCHSSSRLPSAHSMLISELPTAANIICGRTSQ
jgi:hypothetical protein